MPAPRLIFIDIDGTLVGSSGTVDAAVWTQVEVVRTAGVRLAICSGRPAFGVAGEYARRLDEHGWHVFQNGASVLDLASRESRSTTLPAGAVDALVARARRWGFTLELYGDTDYLVESGVHDDRDRAIRHAALLDIPYRPGTLAAAGGLLSGRPVRAQWLIASDDVSVVRSDLVPGTHLVTASAPAMPDTVFASVVATGVDKVHAVRTVAAAHGVDLARTMFVGDGANDASAISAVREAGGWGVAMANADPAALLAAYYTVGHVDHGGLIEALQLALDAGAGH